MTQIECPSNNRLFGATDAEQLAPHAMALRPGWRIWLQPQIALSGEIKGYEATRRAADGAAALQDVPQKAGERDAWMLRRCCLEAASWGGDAHILAEVSTTGMASRDLTARLRVALRDAALDPPRLALQVHAELLAKLENPMLALRRLKNMGVTLVLSGFGAGALQPFALRCELFDGVRIDPDLFAGVRRGSRSYAILCALIELARRLAGQVIVDGVATRPQLAMLRDAGCTLFQGALLGAPTPAEVLARASRLRES